MTARYSIELPNTTSETEFEDQGLPLTIKAILDVVYRRYWVMAIGFLSVFFYVAYMTFTETPYYSATATVIVDTKGSNVIDLDEVIGGIGGGRAELDTEEKILESKSLLRRVVIAENLIDDPEFSPSIRPPQPPSFSVKNTVKGAIKFLVGQSDPAPENTAPAAPMTEEERRAEMIETSTAILQGHVGVARVGTTYLIDITVTTQYPDKSARLANAVADAYRVDQLEAKLETTQRATNWLLERVSGLREEVSSKERLVEEYRSQTGLLAAAGTSLTEQEIASLSAQRIEQEALLNRARARFDNVRRAQASGSGTESIAEVLESGVISNLKAQQAGVLRRQAELESTLGSRHPDLIRVRSEAADIERAISVEIQKIVTNLGNEVQASQDEVNKLNTAISRARGQLIDNN